MKEELLRLIQEQQRLLTRTAQFIKTSNGRINALIDSGYLLRLELTAEGLLFVPTPGDSFRLKDKITSLFGITFTRCTTDFALYQWTTTSDFYDIQITIEANEVINMSGTLPTPMP